MGEQENSESEVIQVKNRATFRLCNVSSFTTEVLEIPADNPTLHVLVIPGNPGIVSFYKDFVESLYELLGGAASVTGKNWVFFLLGIYLIPKRELLLTPKSTFLQVEFLVYVLRSRITSVILSLIVALLGLFPIRLLRLIVTTFLGKLWSATAVEATCSHLVKYHTMRNVLFMAMTEFKKISKQVPDAVLSIEREGHSHAFCCTEAGSMWVAEHVAGLIKNNQAS
ncbi:hypothetical protein C1H46_027269 [Malus baccata]|uniref:Uncharacterized protein n=1 Tax=Malus baccata TaxID=106549 RepID=A0A540LLC5_MALBA|nr:hypothetical protein C1H46_027269 [Malus baccata]